MKNSLMICAAVAVVFGTSALSLAAEPAGAIPAATLSSMGLGSAEILSDDAGLAVRGKGSYAGVFGFSSAVYFGFSGHAMSNNGYEAGAENRKGASAAVGNSNSYAGNKSGGYKNISTGYGHGYSKFGQTTKMSYGSFNINFSGGGASAWAR